jgi:UDP-glucose 6-dehydrogenase
MRTAVVGSVGLESGSCLADLGYEVICIDDDAVLAPTSKPNPDDLRVSPFLPASAALSDTGVTLRAYDPMEGTKRIAPRLAAPPGFEFDVRDGDPR